MKTRRISAVLFMASGIVIWLAGAIDAAPMGTIFTYQGRLMDANDTARGIYDIMFHLYDSPEGPNEIGVTDIQDVEVPDGYFTVALDFGSEVFSGDWRWLEISIRAGDSNDPDGYIPLNPRQQITPAPYALYAQRAGIEVPLSLTGSTDVEWIIGATNNGNGPALGGISTTGYGVRGQSTSGYSVLGTNTGGNYGYLGGSDYGVYGKHAGSDNIGFLGSSDCGVYGQHAGSGNTGFLGGSTCGAYGSSSSDTGYAGYFSGRGYFSGNVGIGTTSPDEMLHIYKSSGSLGLRVSSDATSYQYINLGATNGYSIGRASDDKFFINRDEPLGSGVLRVLTVQSNGNVGIGTTTPDEKLTVEGTIKANAEILGVYGYASNNGDVTNYGGYFKAAGSNGRGVYGLATGQDGCGVYGHAGNGLGGRFESFGMGGVGVYGSAPNTFGKGVIGNGNAYDFYAEGPGTDYGSSSSIRWKRNIQAVDNPLDKIIQLRGVYFDWDEEHGGQHDVGMIAEEVGEVLPEIVQYEEDGIYTIGMDYSKLTPLLVEAVKALKEQTDELQEKQSKKDTQIASQQKLIEELQEEVGQLKHLVKKVIELK